MDCFKKRGRFYSSVCGEWLFSQGRCSCLRSSFKIEMIVCVYSNFKWTFSRADFYSDPEEKFDERVLYLSLLPKVRLWCSALAVCV